MNLEYQISEDDFMAAYEAFWRSGKVGSKGEFMYGAIAVIAGVVMIFLAYSIGWVMIAVGAVLVSLVPIRRLLHKRAYRENAAFAGSTKVRFGDEIIEVVNPIGESRLKWSFYKKVMESDAFFLLMISKRSFSIIPKRIFTSEAELDAFRSLLESKLGAITTI